MHKRTGIHNLKRRRSAFTLIEVLIAAIVLAIGLIGLAAVFPVVITQQRQATDSAMVVSAGASGEAMLSTRLGNFSATINDIPEKYEGRWLRINAIDPGTERELPYLHMPERPVDLRLSREESGLRATGRKVGNLMTYDVPLRHSPLSERENDRIQVDITIVLATGRQQKYSLRPETPGSSTFVTVPSGFAYRLAGTPNAIDYANGRLAFNVILRNNESVRSAEVVYTWLDDRLLSHNDRLFPVNNPRYGWEICIRKGLSGQAQYCLFMYRFGGPPETTFNPDIPDPEGKRDEGMLHLGSFDVFFDTDRRRFFLEEPSANSDESRSLRAGVYILPEEGTAPVKVLRRVQGIGWELEAPPTRIGRNGNVEAMLGRNDFWYMPLSVFIPKDQVTWKITPLLAYTKQVDL